MEHNISTYKWSLEKWGESRFVSIILLSYLALFLVISPIFPGVSWFQLGDFTLPVVNYYHAIMIPLALLLIVIIAHLFPTSFKMREIINLSVYPVLILTVLGLVFFYPTWATTADEIFQALRDILVFIDGFIVLIMVLIFPFKFKQKAKETWGAYLLVLFTGISAEIAGMVGMILEYGNLYGFSGIAFFNSYVTSVGGLDTFLGNAWTTHSHQMLPAVMGLIVGLTAVAFKYEKLESKYRNIVNLGLLISLFGTLSMTFFYWISLFGTYAIPAVFVSGAGGMNGLALDDSQTGIIGIGAIVALIGLIFTVKRDSKNKWVSYSILGTWVGAMASMIGIGYVMEFNEVFYGFGTAGVPPNGGPGYLYDLAYIDGHMLFVFFLLTVAAAVLVAVYLYGGNLKLKSYISGLTIAGIVIGYEGLLIYTMTLSWIVEAIGLWLIVIAVVLIPVSMFSYAPHIVEEKVKKAAIK